MMGGNSAVPAPPHPQPAAAVQRQVNGAAARRALIALPAGMWALDAALRPPPEARLGCRTLLLRAGDQEDPGGEAGARVYRRAGEAAEEECPPGS